MLNIPLDKIIPVTFARDNLANLIKETNGDTIYVLTKGGRPKVALVDIVYLEKLVGHKLTTNNFAASDPIEEPEKVPASAAIKTETETAQKKETIPEPKPSEGPIVKAEEKQEKDSNLQASKGITFTPQASSLPSPSASQPAAAEKTEEKQNTNNSSGLEGTDQVPYMNFSPQEEQKVPTPQIPTADELENNSAGSKPANPIPASGLAVDSPTTNNPSINSVPAASTPENSTSDKTQKKPEGTMIPIKNQKSQSQDKAAPPVTGHANVADMDIG